MQLAYNIYILFPLLALIISLVLAVRTWRYRSNPLAATFLVLMLALAWWSLSAFMELFSADLADKTFWMKMTYPGVAVLPLAWLTFALQYTDRSKWLTRRHLVILSIVPAITLVMVGTDSLHHLMWKDIWLDTSLSPPVDAVAHGAWFWIQASYAYSLLLLGNICLLGLFLRSPGLYRKQVGIILLATLAPWTANFIFIAGIGPFSEVDPTPLAFAITGIAFFFGFSRLHLLDIMPIAHDAILRSMADGVIVLDTRQRIVEMNPSAERIVGRKRSDLIGQQLSQLLPGLTGLPELKTGAAEARGELSMGAGPYQRYYGVFVSPVSTRQRLNGYVVLLNDDTERRKAEFEARERAILETELLERKRAQEDLKISEKKYSTLVEKGNDGIIIIQDGLVKFANSKMLDVVGYPLDETLGKPFFNFISPEFRNLTAERYKKRMSGEEVSNKYEITILTKDNKDIPVEINANIIEYEGKVANMAIIRDITEHKRAEEILKASEAKFRNLVENAAAGIITNALDGRIFSANKAALEIYGYGSEAELIGTSIEERYENLEDRKRLLEFMQKTGTAKGFEVLHRHQDGTPFWASLNIITQVTESGQKQLLTIVEDVTERKQSEVQLMSQKELIDRILASTPNAVLVIAGDHRVLLANKTFCKLLTCEIDEVQGKRIEDIIALAPITPQISEVLAGKSNSHRFEFKYGKNGYHKVLIADILPMEKEEVLLILNDITSEREQQERLYLTDRLATIGELAAGIAHELNNPLTGVIGFSQLIMEGEVPPQMKDDLNIIASESQRAAKIVKNLLTFARKHQPVKQLNQINDCITEVLNIRAYEQKNRNIRVVTHLDPDLPKIMVDYFQMQQVFINIIINAEFFMVEFHNGGSLTITTRKVGGMIRASFSDDGPGITQENLKHLFNPFFTTKEVGKGTGLGLAICHGIVSEHGGRIYAESEPGKGATFIVELPVTV